MSITETANQKREVKKEFVQSFLRPRARTAPIMAQAATAGIPVTGDLVVGGGTATRPRVTVVLWPPVTVTVWEASVYPVCFTVTTCEPAGDVGEGYRCDALERIIEEHLGTGRGG